MAMSGDRERLPCGVVLGALLAQVADGRPAADSAHQADCPYCQAALRALRQGWHDVQALTRRPVPIPAGLTARIMARVAAIARRAGDSILLGHPRGETRVSHALVGRAIQRVASDVPGVVFASARAGPDDPPDPARVSAALRLVVRFGPAIDRITTTVRARLDRRITSLTGAQLTRIDITVEDIAEPRDDRGGPASRRGDSNP